MWGSSYGGHDFHTWWCPPEICRWSIYDGSGARRFNHRDFERSSKVMVALDVLDGKSEALLSLGVSSRKDAFLLFRGIEMVQADLPIKCPVLRQSDQLSLVIGQTESRLFMESTIITDSAEVATNAVSVVEGLQAIAVLRHGEDAAMMRVVEGLEASANDTKIEISWEADASDVMQAAKTMKKRHGSRRNRWKKWKEKQRD